MENNEPKVTIEVNGKSFEFLRNNTTLWTFMGRTAIDHIWLEDHIDEDNVMNGTRFFRELFNEGDFDRLSVYMVEAEYETHLNLREVPDADLEAYIGFSTSADGIIDTIPEDWLE